MITVRAASALGMSDIVGTIAPTKAADFVLLPATSNEDVFGSVFTHVSSQLGVFLGGIRVI
jgi:imidazolonepropionase-like amidohydrolase